MKQFSETEDLKSLIDYMVREVRVLRSMQVRLARRIPDDEELQSATHRFAERVNNIEAEVLRVLEPIEYARKNAA